MTESTDPLVKWDWEIAAAEAAYLADGGDESAMHCIHDLAAEVRALREKLAAQERLAGSAVTTDDVLRVWMQRMERASGQALDVKLATALACITELEAENEALRRGTCGE
jgi:hypothetical protein